MSFWSPSFRLLLPQLFQTFLSFFQSALRCAGTDPAGFLQLSSVRKCAIQQGEKIHKLYVIGMGFFVLKIAENI